MRQNLVAQLVQLLKHWLCNLWLGIVVKKNWALSVDQCWLQVLQFSVPLIDFLSMLLRYNGFTKIQKAVVDQLCNRPPNKDQGSFLVQVWLWKLTWSVFSATELVIASYCIKFTFCCTSQFNTEMVLFCSIEEKKMTF